MPTPTEEQQTPGYATLTLDSVTVQNGINSNGDFSGTFIAGFENVKVNGPDVREDPFDSEVFAVGIHSRDTGIDGVGSGEVGDGRSLIGLKILEVGDRTDVEVPIYPVAGLTDLQGPGVEEESGPLSQRFPPAGPVGESPLVQAAVYTDLFFGPQLPDPVATSDVVAVEDDSGDQINSPLNQGSRPPLIVSDGELVEAEADSA